MVFDEEGYEVNQEALDAALRSVAPFQIHKGDINVDWTLELGRGGYSTVLEGELRPSSEMGRRSSPRRVAIKMLASRTVDSVRFGIRAIRECYAWSRLKHCNVVVFLGFHLDLALREAWLLSPLMSRGTIKAYLKADCSVWEERVRWVLNVAAGLQHMHDQGVAHGDLKPDNILLDRLNVAMITDFGLATGVEDSVSSGLTTSQCFQGTLRYASPECLDDGARDTPADIWSFAMVSLEILTSKAPFYKSSDTAIVNRIVSGNLPVRSDHPEIPEHDILWFALFQCWSSTPRLRPSVGDTASRIRQATRLREGMTSKPRVLPSPAVRAPGLMIRSEEMKANKKKGWFRRAVDHVASALGAVA